MKLSEAIREGAKKRPQGFGWFTTDVESGNPCTCALGAAYEIYTGGLAPTRQTQSVIDTVMKTIRKHAGIKRSPVLEIPDSGYSTPLYDATWRLNDMRGWTREQIADWLEGQGY